MTLPTLTLVVEGPSDADFVRTILGKELTKQTRFFIGRGKMSLASLGRNILVDQGGPVLVVMDADTTNQRMADEQKGMTRLALSRFGAAEDFDVFLFTPTIEVVLFEAPAALRLLLDQDVPDATLRAGLLIPKVTLATLRGDEYSPDTALGLDARVGELLGSGKQATAFRETAQRLLAQHAEA